MRTSKNVRTSGGEGSSITPPSYALSRRASPSLPADGYDANRMLGEEGQDGAKSEV